MIYRNRLLSNSINSNLVEGNYATFSNKFSPTKQFLSKTIQSMGQSHKEMSRLMSAAPQIKQMFPVVSPADPFATRKGTNTIKSGVFTMS